MPFDGSGTFTRLYDWEQDATDGIDINATRMDNEFDGIATALSLCFLRDGSVAMQGDLDLSTNRIKGIGDGTAGTPSIKFNSSAGIYYTSGLGFSVGGSQVATLDASSLDSNSMLRAKGLTLPTLGAGIELGYNANVGYVGVIDRSTTTYKTLNLRGSTIQVAPSGTTILSIDSTGIVLNPGGSTVMTVTSLGAAITGTLTVGGNGVINAGSTNLLPLAGLVNQAQATVVGRAAAAGTGAATALTQTQLTALINTATTTVSGAMPATGTPAGKFLKDDLTWASTAGYTAIATAGAFGAGSASIPVTGYRDLIVIVNGWSHSSGSNQRVQLSTSNGPIGYIGATTIPAAGTISGIAFISIATNNNLIGHSMDAAAGIGTAPLGIFSLDPTTWQATGIIIGSTSGSNDAGTYTIYGR